ncbi:MAG: cation:proton antiporter, partial [Bdellovibrionales bacterium]|nr:cation:proton antiporter [Bdellovibrionales bacterium]
IMSVIIISLACLFFIGHVLQWFFVKTKIPDLLLLIIAGFIAGPSVLSIAQQQDLGKVGPVLATITLIIILYEGGLNLRATDFLKSSVPALILSLLSFGLIVGATTTVLNMFFSFSTALLVGVGIGSTSSAIVFPLIKPLDIQDNTKTVLSLESAFTDVLSIVAFLVILESVLSKNFSASSLVFGFGAKPFISIGLGVGSALLWAFLRKAFLNLFDMPFSGEAWSLLTYGCIEMFQLNGAIGILALGFTLANLNLIPRSLGFIFNLTPVKEKEMSLLKEISFLLRTFFFLYLGMMMQVSSINLFFWAALLVALIYVTRYASVRVVFPSGKTPFFDSLIAFAMGPRGLACAVLATLPAQRGLEDGLWIQNVIFYVIFISIIVTSLFVIFGKTGLFTKTFQPLFAGAQDSSSDGEVTSSENELT